MKKSIQIIRGEYIHFIRSPFKIISLSLYILALLYSFHNGLNLFKKQNKEIESIIIKNKETISEMINQYEAIENGTFEVPRRDPTTPYWAIWNTPSYAFKHPSPMMVFSLGQAEQYGFYKKVTNWSTTFDSDMAEEVANPERLYIGTLDFNFVLVYLLPILIIILLFNVGGLEKDLKFEKLIFLNNVTRQNWIMSRFSFYYALINTILYMLMFIYAIIAGVFENEVYNFFLLLLTTSLYTLLWFFIFYFINYFGEESSDQALKMISTWLVLCLIMPGIIHQVSSIKYPVNYMTEYIDVERDKSNAIFKLPTDTLKVRLLYEFPFLKKTFYSGVLDTDKNIINRSISGLVNVENKVVSNKIEESNENKNNFIKSSYLINPILIFQNHINSLSGTDYYSYLNYRNNIQSIIDSKIKIILNDTWNNITVDKEIFTQYTKKFNY